MVLDLDARPLPRRRAPQAGLSWGDLAGRLQTPDRLRELSAEVDFTAAQPTFPFGAHIAVVEVDAETGSVDLQRMIARR